MPLAHDNNCRKQISADKSICKYSLSLPLPISLSPAIKDQCSPKILIILLWMEKKNPFFQSQKQSGDVSWGVLGVRENPALEGTENEINNCQKATHVFTELRESAAQDSTGHSHKWSLAFQSGQESLGQGKHMDFGRNAPRHFRGLNWESSAQFVDRAPFRQGSAALQMTREGQEGFNLHLTTLQIKTGARLWDMTLISIQSSC